MITLLLFTNENDQSNCNQLQFQLLFYFYLMNLDFALPTSFTAEDLLVVKVDRTFDPGSDESCWRPGKYWGICCSAEVQGALIRNCHPRYPPLTAKCHLFLSMPNCNDPGHGLKGRAREETIVPGCAGMSFPGVKLCSSFVSLQYGTSIS